MDQGKVAMKKLLMATPVLLIGLIGLVVGFMMMTACSSEPAKPAEVAKPQPKPADFLTGRAAFQKIYIAARGWARDAHAVSDPCLDNRHIVLPQLEDHLAVLLERRVMLRGLILGHRRSVRPFT